MPRKHNGVAQRRVGIVARNITMHKCGEQRIARPARVHNRARWYGRHARAASDHPSRQHCAVCAQPDHLHRRAVALDHALRPRVGRFRHLFAAHE